jgi:hypothetical protein
MPHWMLKSFAHRAISLLPGSRVIGDMLRARLSKSIELSAERFESKVAEAHTQMEHFRRAANRDLNLQRIVEIGTGWHPVMPVCYFLCGAAKVWTYDIEPLLRPQRVRRVIELFVETERARRLQQFLPAVRADRLQVLKNLLASNACDTVASMLEAMNVHATTQDARSTGLTAKSVTLFTSSGVLEYIPRASLSGIFLEFERIASSDAVMIHRINLTDQFSYFDPAITPFNYLKYSTAMWKLFDSPLVSQNRMRITDYRALVQDSGFEILTEDNSSGSQDALDRVALSQEFRGYSRDDLLVLHSWLIARRVSRT